MNLRSNYTFDKFTQHEETSEEIFVACKDSNFTRCGHVMFLQQVIDLTSLRHWQQKWAKWLKKKEDIHNDLHGEMYNLVADCPKKRTKVDRRPPLNKMVRIWILRIADTRDHEMELRRKYTRHVSQLLLCVLERTLFRNWTQPTSIIVHG